MRNKSPEGRKCPHSIETQDCVLNVTCFTYKWAYTPFSSCLPLGGSPCGEGITTKAVYCQRSDFRAVDDRYSILYFSICCIILRNNKVFHDFVYSFCSDTIKPSPEEKWCYIDCPVDCEVEGWTSWNISECKCNDTGGNFFHLFISFLCYNKWVGLMIAVESEELLSAKILAPDNAKSHNCFTMSLSILCWFKKIEK